MKKLKIKMIDSIVWELNKEQYVLRSDHKLNGKKAQEGKGFKTKSFYLDSYRKQMIKNKIYCPVVDLKDLGETNERLKVQTSLPKSIYGTNAFDIELEDIERIYKRHTTILDDIGINTAEGEFKNAILRRADFSKITKLPDYLGRADQAVRRFFQFDYKPQANFTCKDYHRDPEGVFIRFENKAQHFTIYDKLAEVSSNGYTKTEEAISEALRTGKIKRSALKFEVSFHRKDSFESFLRRRIEGKKKNFVLEDILNKDLSRRIILEAFDQVFSNVAVGLISLGEMEDNQLMTYLDKSGIGLTRCQKLYYWVHMATKFGEAGTWEELKVKCRGGSVATNKNQISKILVELGRIDGKTPNLISFLRQELSEFKVIKPLSTGKQL